MRPRFSLKWLLIAFTLLSVAFYIVYVYPTAKANQFAGRVRNGDHSEFEAVVHGDRQLESNMRELNGPEFSLKHADLKATIKPRTWTDYWKLRRRVVVLIKVPPWEERTEGWAKSQRSIEWGRVDVTVGYRGVQLDHTAR